MLTKRLSRQATNSSPRDCYFFLTKGGKTRSYLAAMITYYFKNPEEALKCAKAAGKKPGCWYGGITLPSGKRGWAVYRDGKVVEVYAVMRNKKS